MKIRIITFLSVVLTIFSFLNENLCAQQMRVKEALQKIKIIAYPENGRPVNRTVAEEFQKELVPQAKIMALKPNLSVEGTNVFRISVGDEKFTEGPQKYGVRPPQEKDWMFFRLNQSGEGELVSSKQHLLYALFCRIKEDWVNEEIESFKNGRLEIATFRWLQGADGVWPYTTRAPRNYDAEQSLKELARIGCSHILINSLATPFPLEDGPPNEIYYRFYYGQPDLDQFAETELNQGIYPPEYLQANMNLLKKNAGLVKKYGITPGIFINTPRSVPESLLERYPFLRGARIDHTFRSFRPRYTLTLAHPAVRWHYAQLMKKVMRQVPEIAFCGMRTNDAGSGFEYTMTTYAGRNGGPYLVREWKTNEEIAQKAGENILRYLKLLRDSASEIRPDFRVITSLASLPAEGETLFQGLGDRIDLQISVADTADPKKWEKQQGILKKGSYLFGGIGLTNPYIDGVAFPWIAYERIHSMISAGMDRITVNVEAPSRVPYDINRQVLRACQIGSPENVDQIINETAVSWVGSEKAPQLVEAWQICDQVVRNFPPVTLYEGYGFYTLRLWNRPFVPNIENIPDKERAFFEKYINAIFNNPNLVDYGADALWTLISKEDAEKIVNECDKMGWKPLNKAISILEKTLKTVPKDSPAYNVFIDQRDRYKGLKCYYKTLENLAAWIAGVHGYIDSDDSATKREKLKMVREMIADEIENSKDLLNLWQNSKVDFMPISDLTETMYTYGDNFGELLQKRIELMEKHKNDTPYVNPNFMWRMPKGFDVPEEEYLKY